MYSREEKLRAVELFVRYDLSPASVIRELGYAARATLYAWYDEYLEHDGDIPQPSGHRRYSDEQKREAVDHFFEHGQCLARTMRAIGYPSQELLASWIDELEPGRRCRRAATAKIPDEIKERAVVDLVTRDGAAKGIADELGAERATLCNWKRRLLSEEVLCRLPKKTDARTIEELKEYAAELRSDIDRLELRRAILEGAVDLLGKDRSIDPRMLANREKTILVESLRPARKLNALLDAEGMPESCYLCARAARQVFRSAHPHNGDIPRKRRSVRLSQDPRRLKIGGRHRLGEGHLPYHERRAPRRQATHEAQVQLV